MFFIKPNEDTKAFTAEILTRDAFFVFKHKVLQIGDDFSTVTKDTKVVIASPKEISAEYRFFVVDGEVITQSLYKSGGTVYYSPMVDEYIIEFAQKMVDTYQPDRAFVLDVAITPEGLKVIEVNSINSSGMYAIDVQKMIFAIEEMLP
ncbi:MAG: ATP-grasp domain-containing protein [Ignavibacteria bacterium]